MQDRCNKKDENIQQGSVFIHYELFYKEAAAHLEEEVEPDGILIGFDVDEDGQCNDLDGEVAAKFIEAEKLL